MDIDSTIRRVIQQEDGNHTAHHSTLGTLIADALADAGLAQLGDEQVAEYIRDIGDRTELTTSEIADRLTEAIEADLDDEEDA
jgi:hypothetical protein